MAIRIRVYPQNGMLAQGGMLGMNRLGTGAVSASTYFNSRLQTQKQVSSLQLGYERALANERIDKVRLEERLKNPYAAHSAGMGGAYGVGAPGVLGGLGTLTGGLPAGGFPVGLPMGGFPGGGYPMGGMSMGGMPYGGVPGGFPGSGQGNITNQTSAVAANQTVSNSNVLNVSHAVNHPHVGMGYGGYPPQFGGGGFLSGLLGALI